MDIFRRKKFDEAMFAKSRTLAIRVGQYQSSDIKEAHFDYGYIKGDAYKPGGTCAGSGKITFTRIITTFNKLDKVYPEIGLLVDETYEWVKMGEYFINDIEIDRNRNTTTLDLMDGMFKLNRPYESSLTYPAPIQKVVAEIANQTGVKLEDAYFDATDLTGQVYYIDKKPDGKKLTYRDVLGLATQILGRSCFFNRDGNLEIRGLFDSGITITADSYFMHGLTKSEVQYQIAGISCKKDKETITVGMRTGRSLEIENDLMTQSMLDNLYHKIKDIRYYPFNLNYQGHLLLDVGQWVTIKTNKGETFKSPILSQSFTFKGGLRGRISADSKSGNDAQYSYAGTITKKIEQFSEFEKQIQNQIEEADKGFDKKVEKIKNDFNDQIELAKAKAEEVRQNLTETIDQRFRDFDSVGLREARQKADEALRNAGASSLLAQEAKQISEQVRRQLDNKADLVEFQRVKETNQLYERIIGRSESDIAEKVSRMAMTSQLFQVEVGKYANVGGPNMLRNSRADDGLKYWSEANGRLGFTSHGFYFNGQKRMFELRPGAVVKSPRFIVKRNTDYIFNILAFDNNSKYFRVYFCKRKKDSTANYDVSQLVFNGSPKWTNGPVFDNTKAIKKTFKFNVGDFDDGYLQFEYDRNNPNKWGGLFMTELDFYEGSNDRLWQPAPEDATMETAEAVRTVQNQLAGSWAIQNLTSAGSIVSQINATNNQILIEAEKIRLKGKTLLDELTAIDGYFKRLFVGEGNFAKLNAEIIGANTITADKLVMDQAMARMFVSSDIFTDTLAAKEAFINKLRSVVVSATLFEGFKGRIGGFQIGTHDKDPSAYWLTGQNQFSVGMSSGSNNTNWTRTALWVNWGDNWGSPGNDAWFVRQNGRMFCYSRAEFWDTPIIHGNLQVTGNIYYAKESGLWAYWISSPEYSSIAPSNNYLYLYRANSSYDWIPMNKEISDRRYKHNIEASTVSGLDIIEQLKTYSYRKEYDGKIEDISCGIMAQDVQKYVPEAFYENPDGAYSYRTFELVPYLIKAIQELNQKIQKLEKTA
ncbi:tail fiber domain-containing protein [Streptococcus oralis]|uniref:Tail fiber domain-containing protein n=1 Tax=Streptococcus oralis TaxID=1303 RepID=A0AAW5WGQ3_STROR|nr:tail fiber domain-containing protein [Streptococcus oralis]MCY7060142.1 tail fiber domain-containing protein [Streptococcus oralis]